MSDQQTDERSAVWPPPPADPNQILQPGAPKRAYRFVSPVSWAYWVISILILISLGDVLQNVAAFTYATTNATPYLLVYAIGKLSCLVFFVINIPLFLMWLNRCYKNLYSYGVEGLGCSSAWAIGYFFIPIINLFRPYFVMAELWRASDPGLPLPVGTSWKSTSSGKLVGFWWALWLFQVFAVYSNANTTMAGDTAFEMGRQVAPVVPNLIAAILAIFVVKGITTRQKKRGFQLVALTSHEA